VNLSASSHHKIDARILTEENLTMKLLALGFLAIAAVTLVGTGASRAAPFCYNKNSGAFAHWGHCRVACTYYGPGGYCRKVTW
jgi:hypothetical protein